MSEQPKTVKAGDVVEFDVLRWDDGWDFDCPVVVLRPTVRCSPNGDSAEEIVESLCEDVTQDGHLPPSEEENGVVDRQYSLRQLQRRWREAWTGKKAFPVKRYCAYRVRVRFKEEKDFDEIFLVGVIESVTLNGGAQERAA